MYTLKLCHYILNKLLMMIKNYNQSVEIIYNPNWPYISDHPYRILITGALGSGKNQLNVIFLFIESNKK